MFGYVAANLHDLNEAERQRYRAAYCGLCHALGQHYGQASRFALTYDLAFLVLLLGSLYEPPEETGLKRCAPHPVKPHPYLHTRYTDYAADLSVALAYHKCQDDWSDDRSLPARAYAGALSGAYRAAKERQPRACAAIEDGLAAIAAIERDPASPPDAAANRFGALLGQLFACEDDMWAPTLREMGDQLGRFIYFMDAACDVQRDRRTGSYNPLATLDLSEQDIGEMLQLFAARATRQFEKLPLEQDLHLLRSVLYSGIWQKRAAQQAKEAKKQARRTRKDDRAAASPTKKDA